MGRLFIWTAFMISAAFCTSSCGQHDNPDILSSILPVPVSIEQAPGHAGKTITHISAPVPGAPANVADEAYILDRKSVV